MKEKLARFYSKFKGRKKETFNTGKGLILFSETSEAIRAETILKKAGYEVRMVAPPYHLRKGCDLAVEFQLMEQLGIERSLKEAGNQPLEFMPISEETLKPVEIVKKTDFGKWLMIKAANMKITFEKETGNIVNVSGGGCPDVPFLAGEMIAKNLNEAPSPRDIGHTVCAYSLNVAFEESKKNFKELKNDASCRHSSHKEFKT